MQGGSQQGHINQFMLELNPMCEHVTCGTFRESHLQPEHKIMAEGLQH